MGNIPHWQKMAPLFQLSWFQRLKTHGLHIRLVVHPPITMKPPMFCKIPKSAREACHWELTGEVDITLLTWCSSLEHDGRQVTFVVIASPNRCPTWKIYEPFSTRQNWTNGIQSMCYVACQVRHDKERWTYADERNAGMNFCDTSLICGSCA